MRMKNIIGLFLLLFIAGCNTDPMDYEVYMLIDGEEFKVEDASYLHAFEVATAFEETEYGSHQVAFTFEDDISLGIHPLNDFVGSAGSSLNVTYFQNSTTLRIYSQRDGMLNLLENSETQLRGTFEVDVSITESSPVIKLTEGYFNIAK